ncbi:hypothetical protein Chor_015218 [Crotalus horridus]
MEQAALKQRVVPPVQFSRVGNHVRACKHVQLGIIRSVSKPSPGGQSHNQRKLRQLFDYLIIIDFESTCWKDGRRCQEIIEFPAVLLNTSNGEIETEFHMYIQPQEHPTLSEFCIELTGIKQNFYSRRPQGLNGALKDVGILFQGREHSGLDDSRNTARLAWKMIRDGCVMKITKSIDKAPPAKSSITRFGGEKPTHGGPLGINPLVKASPLGERENEDPPEIKKKEEDPLQETVHIGLFEDPRLMSRNSKKTDELCRTTENLISSLGRLHWPLGNLQHPCYRPSGWGDKGHLISNLSRPNQGLVLVPTTLSTVNISETDISTTPECLSLLADWEDVAIIPEKEDGPDAESLPSKDNPPPKRSLATEDRNKLMNWAAENMLDAPPSTELSKSIVYKSPNTTVYNVGRAPNKASDASTFKLPVATTEVSSPNPPDRNRPASSTEAIKRKPSSPKSLPPTKKPSFRIYKDGSPTSSSFLLPRANPCSVSPALLSSSGNFNPTFRAAETGKMTPPLCECGRRARRLNVSNGGPNQGKGFYSCPVRKCERNTKGCNYFRWEDSLIKEKMALPTLTLEAGGLKPLKTQGPSLGIVKCLRLRPSMRN